MLGCQSGHAGGLLYACAVEWIYGYRKNLNNWTVCYVVGLSSPSKVKKFCFFSASEGEKGPCFCCVFRPLSREGNSGLHSTPSNYSSFYGMQMGGSVAWR